MANNEVFAHKGKVTTIEADFNNETGNIAFRATFPNPNGLLRHGETGNILMTDHLNHVLLIPQKATFEVLDKKYVYVVGSDNVVRSRQITIQAELEHVYAVSDGLSESDKVVVEGIRKIKPNDKIQYTTIAPYKAIHSLELLAE
jgi:membrane fusion protein (multidrug efflux system)